MMHLSKLFLINITIICVMYSSNESIIELQKKIAYNPRNTTTLFRLATQFAIQYDIAQAVHFYERLLSIEPINVTAHCNLGILFKEMKETEQSLYHFSRAIELNSSYAKPYLYRAQIYEQQNNINAALEDYKKTIIFDPSSVQAYQSMASIFDSQKNFSEALKAYAMALKLQPNNNELRAAAAILNHKIGDLEQAVEHYSNIVANNPSGTFGLYNLGYTHRVLENFDKAIELYLKVLAHEPMHEQAHIALPLAYLAKGDFEHAWPHYAWRLKKENRNAEKLRSYLEEKTLSGKKIFLRPEGGIGDSLQFIRYAKLLHEYGAYVIVAVQKPLLKLLSLCPYIDQLISLGSGWPAEYDDNATIMSLPAIFNTTNETEMGSSVPYLYADQSLIEFWHEKISSPQYKIGLCWQADLKNDESRFAIAQRSIPLELLSVLTQIPNTTFYCLQKDTTTLEQLNKIMPNFHIIAFPGLDTDHGAFMDTAAIMKNLDLVITVDTSIAHLAGGLGVPVWILLPFHTDWRWIAKRNDSPWYPTMRIFKQSKPFAWQEVVDELFLALSEKLQNKTQETA